MIGIVGYGVVGEITKISIFPDDQPKIHDLRFNTSIEDIFDCDTIFICTPTNNFNDIRVLKDICLEISDNNPTTEIIIRSTVPPGFCDSLMDYIKNPLTYFPEFIRERYALEDSLNRKVNYYATSTKNSKLKKFPNLKKKLKKLEFCELEIMKMMRNNYHAMKVVFANHYYDMCKKYDADYDTVLKSFKKSNNGQSYLNVNEDLRGYGGKCLPKDIDFMIDCFGEDVELFKSIKKDNLLWKQTIRKDK